MIRGIERRRIFLDDADYEAFLARSSRLLVELGFRCFAWALMPNHVHLVLQTGPVPLARLMARLGTSYAVYFNRRHDRVGHLLQNRYRARRAGCEADLLGLVVYVHLNPIDGGLAPDLEALGEFPWCGHGALMGLRAPRAFETPAGTLSLVSRDASVARLRVLEWMQARTCEPLADPFGPLHASAPARDPGGDSGPRPGTRTSLQQLIREVSEAHGLSEQVLRSRLRSRSIVEARSEIARRAANELGHSGGEIARAMGVSASAISRALARTAPSATGEPCRGSR